MAEVNLNQQAMLSQLASNGGGGGNPGMWFKDLQMFSGLSLGSASPLGWLWKPLKLVALPGDRGIASFLKRGFAGTMDLTFPQQMSVAELSQMNTEGLASIGEMLSATGQIQATAVDVPDAIPVSPNIGSGGGDSIEIS